MKRVRSLHKQKGAEVVEFAISAVLLFTILFGIIEFSVALYDKAVLTNASREGARTGILYRAERNEGMENDEIEEVVRGYAESYLISFGDYCVEGKEESWKALRVYSERPDSMTGDIKAGDRVVVTVEYDFCFLLFSRLASLLPKGGGESGLSDLMRFSAITTMRAE